ncbi:hypothetical protein V9T40_014833 [Parthenolecanium corni]|uniref:Uncharacterized protein n=1 Tax=Parthenolecanium corni TaxID=536013 RepID=A0AAN9T4L3_9HEMI
MEDRIYRDKGWITHLSINPVSILVGHSNRMQELQEWKIEFTEKKVGSLTSALIQFQYWSAIRIGCKNYKNGRSNLPRKRFDYSPQH